jgi:hypothetical protein
MIALQGVSMHYTLGASRIDVLREVDLTEAVASASPS